MGTSGHASDSAVVGVTVAMVAMAGLVVLSRLLTRIFIVKSPGLDDAFITASLVFSIATTATMCLQVEYGMGRHMLTLPPAYSVASQKPFYVSIWVYNLAMGCTKFSFLLQYLRIFPQKPFRRAVFVMLGVNTVYVLWTTLSAVFACWPIEYFWAQVDPKSTVEGKCLDRFKVWFANAGMNIATDVAIGVLPLPVLKQLQLPKRQRIALMIIFGLGGFTCIVSILRLQSLYTISRAMDITWENPLAAIWSSVEVNTGILCSCLPTLKAALSRVCPRLFGSQISRGSAGSAPPPEEEEEEEEGVRRRRATMEGLKRRSKLSFDALGRGLSGRGDAMPRSTVSGETDLSGSGSGSGDVQLRDYYGGESGEWDRGIQVVTTVEQDVEKIGEDRSPGRQRELNSREGKVSEDGSQRELFG